MHSNTYLQFREMFLSKKSHTYFSAGVLKPKMLTLNSNSIKAPERPPIEAKKKLDKPQATESKKLFQ